MVGILEYFLTKSYLNSILTNEFIFKFHSKFLIFSPGSSVVEHVPEERSVGGSIPSLGTSLHQSFSLNAN